jgi:hypothetical protein
LRVPSEFDVAKKINNWSLRFLFQRTQFSLTRERNLGIYRTLTIISTSDGCQNDSVEGPYSIGIPLGLVKRRDDFFLFSAASPAVDAKHHIFQAISPPR